MSLPKSRNITFPNRWTSHAGKNRATVSFLKPQCWLLLNFVLRLFPFSCKPKGESMHGVLGKKAWIYGKKWQKPKKKDTPPHPRVPQSLISLAVPNLPHFDRTNPFGHFLSHSPLVVVFICPDTKRPLFVSYRTIGLTTLSTWGSREIVPTASQWCLAGANHQPHDFSWGMGRWGGLSLFCLVNWAGRSWAKIRRHCNFWWLKPTQGKALKGLSFNSNAWAPGPAQGIFGALPPTPFA